MLFSDLKATIYDWERSKRLVLAKKYSKYRQISDQQVDLTVKKFLTTPLKRKKEISK